ncbi:hypothetical protein [Lentibacillus saliphilus]|uniref:hypothetical protein n=1 Tax=Lentibacillus saliphilus TaxID=2737028 RepID=UPI001C2FABDF|nr:hypothetical protein [Lentibacillus saliphilus]
MNKRSHDRYSDFANVKKTRDALIPEEFPEGAFGSPIEQDEPVKSKSTPWEDGQYRQSAFTYADKEQHDDLPRQAPGAHPLHDETDEQI